LIKILRFLDSVRYAVHVHEVCVMGQTVDQSVGQDLVPDDLSPPVEGQVCGDDSGLCIRSEREMIEEQLTAFLVTRHIAELITDDKVISLEACLQCVQRAL